MFRGHSVAARDRSCPGRSRLPVDASGGDSVHRLRCRAGGLEPAGGSGPRAGATAGRAARAVAPNSSPTADRRDPGAAAGARAGMAGAELGDAAGPGTTEGPSAQPGPAPTARLTAPSGQPFRPSALARQVVAAAVSGRCSGGAMNSGPIGCGTQSATMRSILQIFNHHPYSPGVSSPFAHAAEIMVAPLPRVCQNRAARGPSWPVWRLRRTRILRKHRARLPGPGRCERGRNRG